jgi:hypothetical protein
VEFPFNKRVLFCCLYNHHIEEKKFMNEIVKLRKSKKMSTENRQVLEIKFLSSLWELFISSLFLNFSIEIFKTENKIYYISTVAATYVLKAREIFSVCTHQFVRQQN